MPQAGLKRTGDPSWPKSRPASAWLRRRAPLDPVLGPFLGPLGPVDNRIQPDPIGWRSALASQTWLYSAPFRKPS
jgi:hypothetical protein